MKKPLPIGVIVAVAVVALGLVAFLFLRGGGGGGGTWSDEQRQVREAIEKVGGDPTKLDPAMKARYEKIMAENPFSRTKQNPGAPGSSRTTTGSPGSSSSPNAPGSAPR